jgi:hypothetical protein
MAAAEVGQSALCCSTGRVACGASDIGRIFIACKNGTYPLSGRVVEVCRAAMLTGSVWLLPVISQ